MHPFKAITCLAVLVLAIGFAACGGDDDDAAPVTPDTTAPANGNGNGDPNGAAAPNGDATTLEITADPDGGLSYTETDLTVPAGDVELVFDNPSQVQHDVVVDGPDGNEVGRTDIITQGTDTITLEGLEPGEYRYWCSVPGHLEAGMEGTLTVE